METAARAANGTESGRCAAVAEAPGFCLPVFACHSSGNTSALKTVQGPWSSAPKGEQQVSLTGDCNYTSARTTGAAPLLQAHRRIAATASVHREAPHR